MNHVPMVNHALVIDHALHQQKQSHQLIPITQQTLSLITSSHSSPAFSSASPSSPALVSPRSTPHPHPKHPTGSCFSGSSVTYKSTLGSNEPSRNESYASLSLHCLTSKCRTNFTWCPIQPSSSSSPSHITIGTSPRYRYGSLGGTPFSNRSRSGLPAVRIISVTDAREFPTTQLSFICVKYAPGETPAIPDETPAISFTQPELSKQPCTRPSNSPRNKLAVNTPYFDYRGNELSNSTPNETPRTQISTLEYPAGIDFTWNAGSFSPAGIEDTRIG